MSSTDTIIGCIKKFIMRCPLLENERVNIDYIGTEMSYSIHTLPCDPLIQKYVDGGKKKQYQFALRSKELYDEDERINIENSGFYESFEEWLDEKTLGGDFPDMPSGKLPLRFETLSKGYLYDVDGNNAKYQIECRLIYEQEV